MPKRLAQQDRRRSLPTVANPNVSRPRALRPVSFLAMGPKETSKRTLLSPSKLAELQQALGGKVGSRSSVRLRSGKSESQVRFETPLPELKNVPAGKDLLRAPVIEAFGSHTMEHHSRTQTAPNTAPSPSPPKARRLSLNPGLTTSKMELLKAAIKPHPHLPPMSRDPLNRVRRPAVGGSNVGCSSRHEDPAQQTSKPSTRKAKARSVIIGQMYPRKPVPTLDVFDDGNDRRPESMSPEIVVFDEWKGLYTPMADTENSPTTAPTPPQLIISNDNGLGNNSSPKKVKNRRSRGSSFTSAVSKRAQKARSMFVGHVDRDAINAPTASKDTPSAAAKDVHVVSSPRTDKTLTRGSSLGCADYEPDLAVEDMSFATKTELEPLSSAVSENEGAFEQDKSHGTVYAILPEEPIATASAADRSAGENATQPEASEGEGGRAKAEQVD